MTGVPLDGSEVVAELGRTRARDAATRQVAALVVAGKVAGLVRTFLAARTLGVTRFADSYTAANSMPNVLVDILATGATNAAVVPLQSAAIAEDRQEDADRAVSAMLTWVLLATVPIMLVAILARDQLARLLLGASRDPAEIAVASRMLVVLLLQIPMYAVGVVLSGALQARRRFLGPALAPLLSSCVVTATYLLFAVMSKSREIGSVSRGHELLLTGGTTLGVVVLTLPLFLPLKATGFRLRPTLRMPPGHLRALGRLGAAGAIALLAQQAATIVMLRLAAHSAGGVVVMTLALTVVMLPFAVIAVPLATTALPDLSADHTLGDTSSFAQLSATALRRGARFAAGAAIAVAATSPLLAWVLLKSAPGENGQVGRLALTIALGAPGAVGLTVCHLISRGMYAQGRWRAAAVSSSVGWVLTIAGDILLVSAVSDSNRLPMLGLGQTLGFAIAGCGLLLEARRRQ